MEGDVELPLQVFDQEGGHCDIEGRISDQATPAMNTMTLILEGLVRRRGGQDRGGTSPEAEEYKT